MNEFDHLSSDSYCGLLFACPINTGNPTDCQLHDLRLLPPSARLEHWHGLTEVQRQAIIRTHRDCLARKGFQ